MVLNTARDFISLGKKQNEMGDSDNSPNKTCWNFSIFISRDTRIVNETLFRFRSLDKIY